MKSWQKKVVIALATVVAIAFGLSIGLPYIWADRVSVGPAAVERSVASFYRLHHHYPLSPMAPDFHRDYVERRRLRVGEVPGFKDTYFVTSTRGRLAGHKRYFRYAYLTTNTAPLIEELYLNGTNFVSFER